MVTRPVDRSTLSEGMRWLVVIEAIAESVAVGHPSVTSSKAAAQRRLPGHRFARGS